MDDAAAVCVRERVGDLDAIAHDAGEWQAADGYQL